jgi:multimeric flavodoxin WrbA
MPASPAIAIVYHTGYGHTGKAAEAVAEGAKASGGAVSLLKADALSEADWQILDQAGAIVFGAPTYMGSASAAFKKFAEETSKRWADQKWKDKIAAGFTNSGSYSGDKLATLIEMHILAMQHGMIWVGIADLPPTFSGLDVPKVEDINRMGSFMGLMTQSNQKSGPDIAPPAGDLETARRFGKRIAEITARLGK